MYHKQLYETIRNYKTVLAMIKEIRSSGIITDKDYNKICTIIYHCQRTVRRRHPLPGWQNGVAGFYNKKHPAK